jgi:hypothetical protein
MCHLSTGKYIDRNRLIESAKPIREFRESKEPKEYRKISVSSLIEPHVLIREPLDSFPDILPQTEHLTTSLDHTITQIIRSLMFQDEVCFQISDIASESFYMLSLGIHIPCRYSLHSLIGDIPTDILLWILCGILTIGTEDKSPIASICLVQCQYCMSCRSRTCKKVENQRIRITRMK